MVERRLIVISRPDRFVFETDLLKTRKLKCGLQPAEGELIVCFGFCADEPNGSTGHNRANSCVQLFFSLLAYSANDAPDQVLKSVLTAKDIRALKISTGEK